jgi:hypothetical protein
MSRRARRSSSVVPPHTPEVIPWSIAQARHAACAGQDRQIRLASSIWRSAGPSVPTGKKRSASASRQAASSRQSVRMVIVRTSTWPGGPPSRFRGIRSHRLLPSVPHASLRPNMVKGLHLVHVISPTTRRPDRRECANPGLLELRRPRLHVATSAPRTRGGARWPACPPRLACWPSSGTPQAAGGRCQAAHGGLKAPIWAMIAATSSAAHSSLILPSVTR